MRHRVVVRSLFLVLVFLVLATPVLAKELTEAQIKSVVASPTVLGSDNSISCYCQVGNLNSPGWAIGDFLLPPEKYALVFDPSNGCVECTIGFKVSKIHVLMQTAEACQIVMGVSVSEVTYPVSPDCPEPGSPDCASGLYCVSIPGEGLWDIALDICCGCLTMDRKYVLGFVIQSISCCSGSTPDLVTDIGPANLCTNYNDYGSGWLDLSAGYPAWPGNLLVYADAACCSPPVPVKNETWGAIKELYAQ